MDDLISRQDAIDALMEILDEPNHAEFLYTDEICKALERLPSAEPGRKKGEWNTHDVVKILASGKVLDGFMQCTVCGCIFDDHSTEYYYCPNCGADCRGEEDGSNN